MNIDMNQLRKAAATAAGARATDPEVNNPSPEARAAWKYLSKTSEQLSEAIDLLAKTVQRMAA